MVVLTIQAILVIFTRLVIKSFNNCGIYLPDENRYDRYIRGRRG